MNIIEALQALKDGKKVRHQEWEKTKYIKMRADGEIYKEDALPYTLEAEIENVFSNDYELYTEPTKITAEERKALELAKACGYDLLWYDACFLWAHVRGEDEAKVADDDFPPLRALKGLFPRATNPTSIDSLLEGTI